MSEADTHLALTLAKHLRGNTAHHLKVISTALDIQIMIKSHQVNDFFEKLPDQKTLERRIFPLRSDIARFWFHREEIEKVSFFKENAKVMFRPVQDILSQFSFPGVTLSDTPHLRGRMRSCYHAACDSLHGVTEDNISFLRNVTQAVSMAVIELATETEEILTQGPRRRGAEEERLVERVSHYENVETQINIEKLYLSVDKSHEWMNQEDYFYVNPQLSRFNNIMKSFFKSNGTTFNSPAIFKLSKTDL